jgi:hypothetical protein
MYITRLSEMAKIDVRSSAESLAVTRTPSLRPTTRWLYAEGSWGGRRGAVGGSRAQVDLWDALTGEQEHTVPCSPGNNYMREHCAGEEEAGEGTRLHTR